jgi:hypothetical protein
MKIRTTKKKQPRLVWLVGRGGQRIGLSLPAATVFFTLR